MILVLGGKGYIGSVLLKDIEAKCFDVKDGSDIRNLDQLYPEIVKADTIIHLAGLSNDQVVNSKPTDAWQTNYEANKVIADLLIHSGKRIVFASSCSVYGDSNNEWVNEESNLNPLLLYARAKMLTENLFMREGMNSVCLRFATVCGGSPNMRWDLVVNAMARSVKKTGKIIVNGGDQWRPLVHVKDVSRALQWAITANTGIYNVGDTLNNFRIREIANIVKGAVGGEIEVNDLSTDQRSYRVQFGKINDHGFFTKYSIAQAAKEAYGLV